MPNNEATVKLNADISQLQSQMQKASRTIKLANAEFKTAAASMDKWSASEEGLKAKLKQLNTVLGAQKTQLGLLEKELEDTIKLNGENSAAADQMRLRVEGQKAAIANTEKQIRKYDQELDVVTGDLDKTGKEMDDVTKSTDKASDGFTVMKGALADLVASGIKLAISGFKDLINVAKEAYEEFDTGADAMIKATGATGEAAAELTESYKNVAHNVVGDMESIGSALGEINTRFGFTGKELENATEQFTKFADITGTDATEAVRLVSRAMENAGMDTKDYSKLLDTLAKAGQTTGVSASTLAEAITKMGAPMRQLGFSTEESIAMFAQFEKEGVNTETVLAGLKKAVAYFGKEGVNAQKGFQRLLNEIKEAPDVAKASEIAIEAFGSKAGPELVEDIRAGKLEYQDFLDVLKDSTGTVTDTYKATQDGFDKIKLAIQGGKADLGSFVKDIASEYQDEIVSFIDKLKDGIKSAIRWIVQNGALIIETIKSIAKVLATLWAVRKAAMFANAINGVITALKGMATASAAASTATTALNGASGILASLVSPGGAIVLGITAVIAVTASLISIFKEEKEAVSALTKEQQESIAKSEEWVNSYREVEAQRKEGIKTVEAEYGRYQTLQQELEKLVDENGKVKEGYETRVQYILTELNGALGTEITMVDGVIKNYQKEREELLKVIETKKAEAILAQNEAAYAEAYSKRAEAAKAYAEAQNTYNDVLARAEAEGKKVAEIYAEMARIQTEEGDDALQDYINLHSDEIQAYKELEHAVTEARSGVINMQEAYEGYNATIKNYEGLSMAIISGDQAKIQQAMMTASQNMKDHTTATAEELKKQADAYRSGYEEIKKAYDAGNSGIEKAEVENAKKLADLAEKKYKEGAENALEGYDKGLTNPWQLAKIKADSEGIGSGSVEALQQSLEENSPSKKTYQSGVYFADGFVNGMESRSSVIYQKARSLAQQAIKGLKDGQKEGSPSKITTQSGVFFTEGFMRGISSMSSDLIKTIQKMVTDAIDSVGSSEVIRRIQKSGQKMISDASVPLQFGNLADIQANTAIQKPAGYAAAKTTSTINNNYNLVQNNTSPKALTALETYQARRQQMAMLKAMM